ncbi:mitochondrial 37S ribosomal protein bS16m [Thermochaetoides thermophila DSM 1495]|uniref:Mitochondrial ribosomal protein s24-like protein n=1 Tax=Chaetomium thermophilum (strain DSM 1495 / CBS 144.50 / IMI 039719) TaxID=759272 RepID=G0S0M5_CHATD|nr:mitochondrial ribosomal protein s24-like protein [Thermochaetoides thermophila DSM 1495]EGS22585.1 mitochondrial ribosomal protein s24-like protein [Thermochaetoides thermophila DSM 1495]
MVVKIRLARFGRTNQPFYNIVVAHARTARNSKPLEVIGTYDPVPKKDPYDPSGKLHKDIKLDITRAKYWVGILEPKYRPGLPPKHKPTVVKD